VDLYPPVMQLAESGQAEDFLADIRARADRSLYFFAKVILGYKELVDHYHLPFAEDVQTGEDGIHRGWLHARGHFKSTTVTKSLPLWKLAKNPERRFCIVGESQGVAEKPLKDIKWHLLNNGLFRAVYPELVPPDTNATKWTDSQILLPRKQSYDEPSITCVGVEKRITGFHYTDMIYDDIFGEDASLSEADAKRCIEWVKNAPGLFHHPQLTNEYLVGTRWKDGEGDVYGWLMQNEPRFTWDIRAAIEDNEPVFPERFSLETLAQIRQRQGDYKFYCQYMNNPIAPEGADFPPDNIKSYTVGDDKRTLVPSDGTAPLRLESLIRMSMYDVSAGGKSAKAENAIIVAGMASDKRVFVLEAWMRNCLIGSACEIWLQQAERFRTYHDHYECIGAQKAVEDVIKLRNMETQCPVCLRKHRRLTPIPVKPPGGGSINKDDRIRMYLGQAIEERRLYLRRGQEALRRQIITFPHNPMKDGIDALAYVVNKLYPPPSSEYYLEEKDREESNRALQHSSRTNTEHDYGGYV
jgi:hypothetical protein